MLQLPDVLPKGIYQLVTWPDSRLLKPSEDCVQEDLPELQKMVKPMIKIMEEYRGVGLAAVQIGVHKKFCVLYTNSIDPVNPSKRQVVEMINPVIIETEGELVQMQEGCLSLPLFQEPIDRHTEVTVRYKDMNWQDKTAILTGVEAECIQHEIEHMLGKPICTKVSTMKMNMWNKKLMKARKHGRIKL
jgi:peptide deformylase